VKYLAGILSNSSVIPSREDAAITTAQQIADYILWSSHESGSFLSNLKLQKLLYYVQAWHLAVYGRPLFPEKFQAWIHGPVVPEIYRRYQGYQWRNIDEGVERPGLDRRTMEFVDEVLEEYGPLDARRLEYLTRREDPWIEARKGVDIDEPCFAEIDECVMQSCYRQRLSDAELRAMLRDADLQSVVGQEDTIERSGSGG
jgi:uncharacterized phage-associated protein